MQLTFIKPKDRIQLLKDGKLTNSLSLIKDKNWKKIPKDSILEVSQVYIRNKGWYSSSLTFKVISGPIESMMDSSEKKLEIEYAKNSVNSWKATVKEKEEKNYTYTISKGMFSEKLIYKTGSKEEYLKDYNKHNWNSISSHLDDDKRDLKIEEAKLKALKNKKFKANRNITIRVLLSDVENWHVKLIKSK
jgi:hypothetical protein